jgi:F-type H+-transporting ATP synthase subunit e
LLKLNCQILRWSALGAGVLYGVYHQAALSTSAKLAAIDRAYEHKQKLIEQAKAEFSKSKLPQSSKTTEGDSTLCPIDQLYNERSSLLREDHIRKIYSHRVRVTKSDRS